MKRTSRPGAVISGLASERASLGRPAGDELLRQVAQWRIAGDANLVSRVAADVFAVVLPEVRQGGDLARMLDKMINAFLEHPFHLNGSIFRIAARGGVALFPDDGAEAALKKAKTRGERYLGGRQVHLGKSVARRAEQWRFHAP